MRVTTRITVIAAALAAGLLVAWWSRRPSASQRTREVAAPVKQDTSVQQTSSMGPQQATTSDEDARGSACTDAKVFPPGHKKEVAGVIYTAARMYEDSRGRMAEIHANETRSEPWASRREREVTSYSEQDIRNVDPDAKIEIDCRSSSCRIRIYSEKTHLIDAMGDYPFACMARYGTAELDQGPPGNKYADFYILFGDQNLDDDAFFANRDRTCPKYREEWLTFVSKPFK